jgi:hypothetical protein
MLVLPHVNDFVLAPDAGEWIAADWQPVATAAGGPGHATRFRAVYSTTGIYVAFECHDDRRITTGLPDGGDLWDQDVVEAFFWPDESRPLYLEYELSPAGSELLLLVPNRDGEFMGWSPWHFEGERKTRKSVRPVSPAPAAAGDARGPEPWIAEFFIPFALFKGVCKIPPTPGTIWRANFCRIDHDGGSPQLYSWSAGIGKTFHDLARFGHIRFG